MTIHVNHIWLSILSTKGKEQQLLHNEQKRLDCLCLSMLTNTGLACERHPMTLHTEHLYSEGIFISFHGAIFLIYTLYICNNAFTNVKRTRFKPCRQLVLQRLLFSRDIPRSQTQTLQHYLHTWYSHPFASSYFRFVFVTLVRIWVSPMSIRRT